MTKEEYITAIIIVSLLRIAGGQLLEEQFYISLDPIKRRITEQESAVIEVCGSTQNFEKMDVAINQHLQQVTVHPDTWVFVTRCTLPGKACRGVKEGINSVCRPKKSWIQVYGRSNGEVWQPHWVAVETACVCSLRLKTISKMKLLP